ncbi:MAG: ThuA domain-containing protein [Verrucomicrobiota bacterium]
MNVTSVLTGTLFIFLGILLPVEAAEDSPAKPHAVFVIGTLHYSPELTMPVFAEELERFGFETTIVFGGGNPEKKTENVLPGLSDALTKADVAIFFSRFMKLPDEEWAPIESYLQSGKPVIGLRTANHSFKYAKDHPRYDWNEGFGRRALGSPYVVHQAGSTDVVVVDENLTHPIMSHVTKKEWISPGTLYLARLEEGCLPLVMGSGKGRERLVKRDFGDTQVKVFETAPIAWAWETEWGGKSFYTSFGHPGDFAEESFVRMFINSCFWAVDKPVPLADAKISTWNIERVDKKPKK